MSSATQSLTLVVEATAPVEAIGTAIDTFDDLFAHGGPLSVSADLEDNGWRVTVEGRGRVQT